MVFLKKIGIIGGAGPLASTLLYKKVVELSHQVLGSEGLEVMIINYPFSLELLRDREKTSQALQECFDRLTTQGVDLVTIACNSLHGYLDQVTYDKNKLIHIAQTVVARAKEKHMKKILILGTSMTKHYGVYTSETVIFITPTKEDQKVLLTIIQRVLSGIICKQDSALLIKIAHKVYQDEPFDGVVLGCTDLSVIEEEYPLILIEDGKIIPVLDSITILAEELIKLSVK